MIMHSESSSRFHVTRARHRRISALIRARRRRIAARRMAEAFAMARGARAQVREVSR